MRHRSMIAAVIGLVSLPITEATAQSGGGWQTMTFHDLRTPSTTDPLQTLVWPDFIDDANAYVTTLLKRSLDGKNAFVTALSSTYQAGERTIIISTVLARGCDSGANDKGADIEPSICPLRIVVIADGKVRTSRTDTGCYIDHENPDLPAKNRADASYTRFDPKTGTIGLKTIVGGRDVPSCARIYSVN